MYEAIIKKYLGLLSLKDINDFANKNNMPLKPGEDKIIYDFIMKYWKELYNGNSKDVFIEYKKYVSNETYNNTVTLYNNVISKIKH